MTPELDIVLPVHNEASTIEGTLREIHKTLEGAIDARFIVCEDGSKDGTPQILERLSQELPIELDARRSRRGYSRAIIDGFGRSHSDFVLVMDSDGQCDPHDILKLWHVRHDFDLVQGWRVKRSDIFIRRALSKTYHRVYRLFFRPPVHDPSCGFILLSRPLVEAIRGQLGVLDVGLLWEVTARAWRAGFSLTDLPIRHRKRAEGGTRVYLPRNVPRIAFSHFKGLITIWLQTRRPSQRK